MNKSAIEKGVEKMLENLVFKDVDTNYNYRLEGPNKNGKYTLFLEYDVDFKKMVESDKYGTQYQQKIYQINNRLSSMEKFLGLDHKNFSLWVTFDWKNSDYLDHQLSGFIEELKKNLVINGYDKELIDSLDIWATIEFMEEDDPYYKFQVGTARPSYKIDNDLFEQIVVETVKDFPDLNYIAEYDLDIWFPDNY